MKVVSEGGNGWIGGRYFLTRVDRKPVWGHLGLRIPAWTYRGGCLEIKDMRSGKEGNRFGALMERARMVIGLSGAFGQDPDLDLELWLDSAGEMRESVSGVLRERQGNSAKGGGDWWEVMNAAECGKVAWKRDGGGALFSVGLASEPFAMCGLGPGTRKRVQVRMWRMEGAVRDALLAEVEGMERTQASWIAKVVTTCDGDAWEARRLRRRLDGAGILTADEDEMRNGCSWTGAEVRLRARVGIGEIPFMGELRDGAVWPRSVVDREYALFRMAEGQGTVDVGAGSRHPRWGGFVRKSLLAEGGLVERREGREPEGRMVAIGRREMLDVVEGRRVVLAAPQELPGTGRTTLGGVMGSCVKGDKEGMEAVERFAMRRHGVSVGSLLAAEARDGVGRGRG